jgi:hypothetical protein
MIATPSGIVRVTGFIWIRSLACAVVLAFAVIATTSLEHTATAESRKCGVRAKRLKTKQPCGPFPPVEWNVFAGADGNDHLRVSWSEPHTLPSVSYVRVWLRSPNSREIEAQPIDVDRVGRGTMTFAPSGPLVPGAEYGVEIGLGGCEHTAEYSEPLRAVLGSFTAGASSVIGDDAAGSPPAIRCLYQSRQDTTVPKIFAALLILTATLLTVATRRRLQTLVP